MSPNTFCRRQAFSGDTVLRCSSSNQAICSGLASGNVRGREELPEHGVVLTPSLAHEGGQRFARGDLVGAAALAPALHIAAVKNEAGDALGMSHGVGDRHRAALRHAEQREALEPARIDDALQVGDHRLEGKVGHVPVRQAVAALVVANKRVPLRQAVDPVLPDRALPVELEVRHPVGRPNDRRARARQRVGDPHAVGRRAEADLLPLRSRRCVRLTDSSSEPLRRRAAGGRSKQARLERAVGCARALWRAAAASASASRASTASSGSRFCNACR